MRFLRTIFFLLLAPVLVRAQLPVVLPPGMADRIMVRQPVVDVSQMENVSVTAEFDPPAVRPGDKSFYRVTITATQNSIEWPDEIAAPPWMELGGNFRGQVPLMDGGQFHPFTSFVYEATTPVAGYFVISNFIVKVGGKPVEIPAAALDVSANNPAPIPLRRLWLDVSATNLFFGQPFDVRVILPADGNQIEALNGVEFNGSGYMTDKIATHQSVVMVNRDGQQKMAFVYETVATPLAAGPLTISAQAFTGGSPRYMLLCSDPVHLNVRPLPAAGELPGFTGALGEFNPAPLLLSTNRLRVGEPVHLSYGFRPATSLTRYVPPATPRSRDWQIIPDAPPASGFTLIPLTDETATTPAIPFSAFNPATKSYYDLTIPALPVTVIGDGLPVQLPAWSSDDNNPAPLKLSDLAATPGKKVATLRPLQLQAWFVFLQIFPVYVFYLLWQWDARRRFLEAHPEIVRRRQAKRDLHREKIKLQKAVVAGDAGKFVSYAAAAMRIAVAPHFPADARALVGGDVLSQLDEADRGGQHGETVRKVFAAADAQFATTTPARADLLALNTNVAATLKKLEERL